MWGVFTSCQAEKLGVFVPPTGVDSVSRYDLERDMRFLFIGKVGWVSKRMKQMGWANFHIDNEYEPTQMCFILGTPDHISIKDSQIYYFHLVLVMIFHLRNNLKI